MYQFKFEHNHRCDYHSSLWNENFDMKIDRRDKRNETHAHTIYVVIPFTSIEKEMKTWSTPHL